MDDRVLALCELSNDLLYAKIPRERLAYYVDESLSRGAGAAHEFSGHDIHELYRKNRIAIEYSEAGNSSYGVILRGQAVLSKTECKVELYRASIEELARHSIYDGALALDYESALKVHLSHEFFHWLEYSRNAPVPEGLEGVTSFSFLGFQRKSRINRCSEIAAHAFAKELLSLPFLPNLYDYMYLMDTGKLLPGQFEGLLKNMELLLAGKLQEA